MHPKVLGRFIAVMVVMFLFSLSVLATTNVSSVSPARNALGVSTTTTIQVTFSAAMQPLSFNDGVSFIVRGAVSGFHGGTIVLSGGNTIATFTPTTAFTPGEQVVVDITSLLQDAGAASIIPFVYSFTVATDVSNGTFAGKVDHGTGDPVALALGDINADGFADVVVVNHDSNSVSVLMNNGNGTFAAKVDYGTGPGPTSVAVADLDGDGILDLAVVNSDSTNVSILENYGDGTFAPKVDVVTGGPIPYAVAAGDVDGDGDVDLIVTDLAWDKVYILKNTGSGSFAAGVAYTTSTAPYAVALADLDGDGDLDVATANYDGNNVSVLKNNGDGTFAAKVDYATVGPYKLAFGDLNGDGDADLTVAGYGFGALSTFENNGDGTFASGVNYVMSAPIAVSVGDVDGDGDVDLAAANPGSATVSILKNNGSGSFVAGTAHATGAWPASVALGDVNGDGLIDMVTANATANTVSVLIGNRMPVLSTSVASELGTFRATLNGTASASGLSTTVRFLIGTTSGTYTDSVSATPGSISGMASTPVSAALTGLTAATTYCVRTAAENADGYSRGNEVSFQTLPAVTVAAVVPSQHALTASSSTSIQVTFSRPMQPGSFNDTTSFIVSGALSGRHNGSISFTSGDSIATFTPAVAFMPGEMVVVDLTSNLDATDTSYVVLPFVYTFAVAPGPSGGSFAAKVDYSTGNGPHGMAVGDLDGDGDVDIVTSNDGADNVSILKNNGDGSFATKVDYPSVGLPYGVAIGDLNGDGYNDIAVANAWLFGNKSVAILINSGDGTFAAAVDYVQASGPQSVAIGDVNGDGHPDVVATLTLIDVVVVLINNGDGTLADAVSYAAGDGPTSVALGDIDGDGDMDLAVSNLNAGTVSMFLNNGDGSFSAKTDFPAGSGSSKIAVGDLDGDGDIDLAVTRGNSNVVSIMTNNGSGTFSAGTDYTTGSSPFFVQIGDLDGDGDLDLAVANAGSSSLSVFKNNGNATFAGKIDHSSGSGPYAVAIGDVDGDDINDLLSANHSSNSISVLASLGGILSGSVTTFPASSIGGASATLNGSVNPKGDTVAVRFLYGTSSGVYTDSVSATPSAVSGASATAVSTTVTGLNGSTTYFFRIAAATVTKYVRSSELSFTTFAQTDSIPGTALATTGSGDYVNVPYDSALNPSDNFTVEFWARADSGSGYRCPLGTEDGATGTGYYFYINPDGYWQSWLGIGPPSYWSVLTGPAAVNGVWYHLAMTYASGKQSFYVNGELQDSISVVYLPATSFPLRIGALAEHPTTFAWKGRVDEVRLWSVGRTVQQIRGDMHRTLPGTTADVIAYFQLNEGSADTTRDAFGQYAGVLVGSPAWVASTVPVGGGTSSAQSSFTTGTASLGSVSLTTTDAFDNAIDLTATHVSIAPNALPGISSTELSDRYWVVNAFGTPGTFSADLTFTVPTSFTNNGAASVATYTLYRRSSSSDGSWTAVVSGASGVTSTSVTFSGVTSFSQFTIGTNDPLPVQMVGMSGEYRQQTADIRLSWRTASEVDNVGWEIERRSVSSQSTVVSSKTEASSWLKIGFVEGAGTSTSPREYSFTDANLTSESRILHSRLIYRLKQIDRSGSMTISHEVEVEVGTVPTEFSLAQNYPNPFNPSTTIRFGLPQDARVRLAVFDLLGREVATLVDGDETAGLKEVRWDASAITSGTYFYRITAGEYTQVRRLVLMR